MDEDGAMVGEAIVAWATEQRIVVANLVGSKKAVGIPLGVGMEVGNDLR